MPTGPLAVLPLTGQRVAVVWTLPAARAEALQALDSRDFEAALQQAFGYRLGRFLKIGRRDAHPLHRVQSAELVRDRIVLVGNAAIALHPVAGQGFNLALRDVAALAEVIADSVAMGADGADIGSAASLEAYRRWRSSDQRKLASFTHALVRGFGLDLPGLGTARGLGLMAFDLLPGTKSLLARHTMGLAGRMPRLARHLGLAP
jgi:2-octaprenyl-6-methoxyphenol hydroxylase